MGEKDESKPTVEVIDEQRIFTLAELCRSCAVEAELIARQPLAPRLH